MLKVMSVKSQRKKFESSSKENITLIFHFFFLCQQTISCSHPSLTIEFNKPPFIVTVVVVHFTECPLIHLRFLSYTFSVLDEASDEKRLAQTLLRNYKLLGKIGRSSEELITPFTSQVRNGTD